MSFLPTLAINIKVHNLNQTLFSFNPNPNTLKQTFEGNSERKDQQLLYFF